MTLRKTPACPVRGWTSTLATSYMSWMLRTRSGGKRGMWLQMARWRRWASFPARRGRLCAHAFQSTLYCRNIVQLTLFTVINTIVCLMPHYPQLIVFPLMFLSQCLSVHCLSSFWFNYHALFVVICNNEQWAHIHLHNGIQELSYLRPYMLT